MTFQQLGCGCIARLRCCLCNGQSVDCYPYHFAEGRWRLYGRWELGTGCPEKEHRKLAMADPPGNPFVTFLRPTPKEREMLRQVARLTKDRKLYAAIRYGMQADKELPMTMDGVVYGAWRDLSGDWRPDPKRRTRVDPEQLERAAESGRFGYPDDDDGDEEYEEEQEGPPEGEDPPVCKGCLNAYALETDTDVGDLPEEDYVMYWCWECGAWECGDCGAKEYA